MSSRADHDRQRRWDRHQAETRAKRRREEAIFRELERSTSMDGEILAFALVASARRTGKSPLTA